MSGVPAEVGSTANNYQILARLAVGGMAEIFLARGVGTTGLERYCVLKRILRNRASDVHFVRMFLDEARLAAQLNHPNVAQVYDIGKLSDSYFFTMEYVHGETVRALLQRARSLRRELPVGAVLTIMAGAAAGLHHAHDRLGLDGRPLGIVHRDVSPSNLMVSYEGGVKLVDFGVAKAADRMQETRSGTVKGKISYLSPEQCRGAAVDRRTDLFALGIVMWETLTLERLYRRTSDFENMSAIVNEAPPVPSSRRKSIPPELDALVMRLLSKRPDDRYQTADDVIEAIEQVASQTGSMISSSSLGRLLREMFGQRPEPWLEMEAQDAPEGVTVTSEPVPAELGHAAGDPLDLRLSDVPDLSRAGLQPLGDSDGDDGVPLAVAPASSARAHLTAQLRGRTRDPDASQPSELAPALPPPPAAMPASATGVAAALGSMALAEPGELPLPAPPHTVPEVLPHRSHPVSSPRISAPQVDVRRSGPMQQLAVPGSGGHPLPNTGSGRHSVPGSGGYAPQTGSLPMIEEAPPERPARGWMMIAVILAAMVIGSLTVLLVMKSGRGSGDGSVARGPSVQPVPAVAPSDAGVALSVTPIDAEEAQPAVPEAPPVLAAAPDAGVSDAGSSDAGAPAVAAPPEPPAPPEPTRRPLELAMDERRYADAVAVCGKRVTAADAAACTLAACHARLDGKAKSWFARVPQGERSRLLGLCRSLGIDPVPSVRRPPSSPKPEPSDEDKCERDPMACQH